MCTTRRGARREEAEGGASVEPSSPSPHGGWATCAPAERRRAAARYPHFYLRIPCDRARCPGRPAPYTRAKNKLLTGTAPWTPGNRLLQPPSEMGLPRARPSQYHKRVRATHPYHAFTAGPQPGVTYCACADVGSAGVGARSRLHAS